MTLIDGNYFQVYLLPRACSWMAMEMAEVSIRVNFGRWAGRLTCPEKSAQREYLMISGLNCLEKKVWNSVPGKYRTGLHLVCSTHLLTPRIGLYTASVVSLKDALIGWRASDCDTPIQLLRIQINTGNTVPSPTCRPSPTSRKQKAFPFPWTVALWVFCKSR